jgi:hypothetical protein
MPREDRSCLANSLVFGRDPSWQQLVLFATETPQWRLVLYAGGTNQLQLTIEPVQGDLRRACESVWSSVCRAGQGLRPVLDSLDIVDEGTTHVIGRGSVGLLPQGRRREFWAPIAISATTGVFVLATGADSAALRGAVPAFVAGLLSLGVMVIDTLRKKLVWHA